MSPTAGPDLTILSSSRSLLRAVCQLHSTEDFGTALAISAKEHLASTSSHVAGECRYCTVQFGGGLRMLGFKLQGSSIQDHRYGDAITAFVEGSHRLDL